MPVAAAVEEERARLQARLIALSRMMFWSFLTLLSFLASWYALYPSYAPAKNSFIFGFGAVMLAVMAAIWRGLLLRGPRSLRTLNRIDLVYALGAGMSFAVSAALAPDLKPSAYVSLIFSYLTVFSRALVVPSSGPRTTYVTAIALVPLEIAAVILVLTSDDVQLPPTVFIGGSCLISVVVVVLATAGSRIIYGLRQQVSEAVQLGRYKLGRKIGAGGMGAVYHAQHELLRRPTAIKLLLPDRVGSEDLDRFELEVQHMSRLTHPNTVAVFDYGRSVDGIVYYAMEYLGGIDLQKLVAREGPQPAGRVIDILAQVCGALHESHELGHIHRDIKPANIILCERGRMPDVAKVVDFGLVKDVSGDRGGTGQVLLGTPHYIAPEMLTDPARIGPAADLYALGATGYFLLTGKVLFEGKTTVDIVVKHVRETPLPPSRVSALHVDAGLEALIMACLAKDPSQRPASAAVLGDALRALPRPGDWSTTTARTWWRDYHASIAAEAPAMAEETRSMTIDLLQRASTEA
jgi:serine/threonine-protein kinase